MYYRITQEDQTGGNRMADQYHSFTMSPLTAAQQRAIAATLLDAVGRNILLCEYDSTSQVLSVHCGGADLTAFLTEVRAIAQRSGRAWATDVSSSRSTKVETGPDARLRRLGLG